jgi:hypothetical protein
MEQTIFIFLGVCAVLALILKLLLIRRAWRFHRHERRLSKLQCPKCEYPLRFNGSEFWCSECGYKYPLKL